MLARLFLALLLAAFAVPSMAVGPCHDAPMTAGVAAAGHRHAMPVTPAAPERHAAPHACIGCIPPTDWRAARIAMPRMSPRLAPLARIARLDAGPAPPPSLPPPRRA